MAAWIWLVLGLGLIALELFAPSGFYLFILGVAAIVVGAVGAMGLLSSWMGQSALFSLVAVLVWLGLGEKLRSRFVKRGAQPGQVIGRTITIAAEIAPGHHGSGELWGVQWRLENVDSTPLLAGSEVVVVSAEGITLRVKRRH
jgi:membrane protein implicated in regulation of membrane protease activity